MSDEARIAPSSARERRAWRSGLRPRPQWIVLGALCWVAAALARGTSAAEIGARLGLGVDLDAAPADLLGRGLIAVAAVAVGILGIVLAVRGATGSVGLVGGRPGGLPTRAARLPVAIALGLGLLAIVATIGLGRGIVAGAARGAAASQTGLFALWGGTFTSVFGTLGVVLVGVGILEWILLRWAQRRALYLTPAQAREERRASGGIGR